MATKKVTITLPEQQLDQIRDAVANGQAASVSSFIQLAVLDILDPDEAFRLMIEEDLERTGGPLTEEEKAWADRILAQGSRASDAAGGQRPDAAA
jgi:Arc/MetJ-type ribon-helix-helix transcriptional regulator